MTKQLKITIEERAYSEEEAKEYLDKVREDASTSGYTLGASGYTYKCKKSKGEITDEGWLCKYVKIYDDFWD